MIFYEPYESFVLGKIVQSFDALMDALDNEDYEVEKVVPFLDKHFKYQDGRSRTFSQKICLDANVGIYYLPCK